MGGSHLDVAAFYCLLRLGRRLRLGLRVGLGAGSIDQSDLIDI